MFLCTLLGRRLSLLVRELLAFVEVRRTLTTLAVVFQAYHKFCPVTVLGSPSPYFVRARTKGSHSRHYYTHNSCTSLDTHLMYYILRFIIKSPVVTCTSAVSVFSYLLPVRLKWEFHCREGEDVNRFI